MYDINHTAIISIKFYPPKMAAVRPAYTSVNIHWNTRRLIQEGCRFHIAVMRKPGLA